MSAILPWFGPASALAAALVVACAAIFRGRFYATFAAVLCAIQTSVTWALAPRFAPALPVLVWLQVAFFLNLFSLVWARMRPTWWRVLISYPGLAFAAGTFLAAPWAIARGFSLDLPAPWAPYALAALGFVQSVVPRREHVHLALDGGDVGPLARARSPEARSARPLTIVQITDPHLGPFMSRQRLRGFAERAVAMSPDLVVLTGDFLTMESHDAADALAWALAPLADLRGRTFACRGNHDHEAPETVARGLSQAGVTLLIDESVTLETPAGRVQVVGLDFAFRQRGEKMARALGAAPREPGALRLVLLHDPGAFALLPDGDADLVLSGHTHGGQLGFLSLGLRATVVSLLTRIPDHGLWAQGRNRLYVHRGTGHYGFPIRLGVPPEESLLLVHRVEPVGSAGPGRTGDEPGLSS